MSDQLVHVGTKLYFGGDPEIFLSQDGRIVGSERALPEAGIESNPWATRGCVPAHMLAASPISIIRDGIQVEFNIPPTDCREWFCLELQYAFRKLREHLAKMAADGKRFEVSFRQVVEVDKEELKALSKMSRTLGCAPSFNWYTPEITVEKRLKAIGHRASTYPIRSAGGHIHLGLPEHLMSEREKLAPILDVLLGNTAVMIDRDTRQVERRKVYGGAGEFRLPRYGFEYRTLSNFWLRSKELTSLVLGLARLAVYVLDTSAKPDGWPADIALMNLVDLRLVEKAINTNDLKLAKSNFEGVKQFLRAHVPGPLAVGTECGLDGDKLNKFDTFLRRIEAEGLDAWFPEDPMFHWNNSNWLMGWENFLETRVGKGKI